MFNCYLHGWSNPTHKCPECFPAHLTTFTSTDCLIGVTKSHIDFMNEELSSLREENEKLKEKNKRLVEGLKELLDEQCLNRVSISGLRRLLSEYGGEGE